MSSVSFPGFVSALARRVFNVVSTLSISAHYYNLQDDKRHLRQHVHNFPGEPFGDSDISRGARSNPLELSTGLSGANASLTGPEVSRASTIPVPLLSRQWWSSIASSLERQPEPSDSPETPSSGSSPSKPPAGPSKDQQSLPAKPAHPPDVIHQLMMNPALSDPLRTPRYPIVLCHGLYGFDSRGPTNFPSLRMHYWANTLKILRGLLGAEVIVTSVPGTGSIGERATRLDDQLQSKARGRGVNFLAHSMGGLDCRHLITHIKPSEYTPLSLTSVSTPHRGSPFMDWCVDNIGIGKLRQHERQLQFAREQDARDEHTSTNTEDRSSDNTSPPPSSSASSLFNITSLPSSFTTLLLSTVDSPAYANLTTTYLNEVFNPATPNDPKVKYFSVAGRAGSVGIFHPFWFTKMVVDGVEEKERARLAAQALASGTSAYTNSKIPLWADERQWGNDGLVTVQSAQWGEFLGVLDNVDHWEIRGARGLEFGVDLPAIPSIGLGLAPSATSLGNIRPSLTREASVSSSATPAETKSETTYIREWLRFTDGWVSKAKETKDNTEIRTPSHDHNSPSQTEGDKEESQRQRQREFTNGDQVVRSSTDRLSLVFDWIVETIPSPHALASISEMPTSLFSGTSNSPASNANETGKQPQPSAQKQDETASLRALADAMVAHSVSGSSSSPPRNANPSLALSTLPNPPAFPPDVKSETLASEVKKMMQSERKGWRKNELATKAELERFYVALSRKMYDEGL